MSFYAVTSTLQQVSRSRLSRRSRTRGSMRRSRGVRHDQNWLRSSTVEERAKLVRRSVSCTPAAGAVGRDHYP